MILKKKFRPLQGLRHYILHPGALPPAIKFRSFRAIEKRKLMILSQFSKKTML